MTLSFSNTILLSLFKASFLERRLLVSEFSISGASKLLTESILFCLIFSRSSGEGEKNKAHKTIIAALSDIAVSYTHLRAHET